MMSFIGLTMICSSVVIPDKRHVAPHLSLVYVADLNRALKSEVFVSEDRQLRAVHLVLDFEPILDNFQEVGHAIRAGDPKLCRIDISIPRFLTQKDIMPVELPPILALPEAVTPKEETTFSCLSLKEEIDQFQLGEEGEVCLDPVEISDTEGELDKTSSVRTLGLIFAKIDDSSKEEEEKMSLNPRKCLKDLLTRRNKRLSSKEALKFQPPTSLPPPVTSLLPIPNLKKKRKEQEMKEGKVVHQETKK